MAHVIVKRMSSFVRQIDFALEWNLIEAGASLFRFFILFVRKMSCLYFKMFF